MPKPTLMVIVASTRPGRAGRAVADWFVADARELDRFDLDVVDLAELSLPMMDEPNHPRLREYVNPHTHAWSARVEAADAVAFVMPEYNHGFTAPLKNAIDYLHHEWHHKPAGLVTYGGVAAGTRAAQMIKQVLVALRMVPIYEAVPIPFIAGLLDDEGRLEPTEPMREAAASMLAELERVEAALRPLRSPA